MRFLVIPLAALLLCSCTAPKSPAQAVYALEQDYAAALSVAVRYEKLPRCYSGLAKICSSPSTISAIKQADVIAWNAITKAQESVYGKASFEDTMKDLNDAENAVSEFKTVSGAK